MIHVFGDHLKTKNNFNNKQINKKKGQFMQTALFSGLVYEFVPTTDRDILRIDQVLRDS